MANLLLSFLVMAFSFRGVPYQWGGMSYGGIDCSGLLCRSARAVGISIPRTAHAQFLSLPAVKELLPGDAIYFGRKKATHCGIYLGGGRFIHASRKRGVVVENLGKRRIMGVRRVLSSRGTGRDVMPFDSKYNPIIKEAAKRYGVPASLLNALIFKESSFNPQAVSPKGAVGLGQFTKPTWQGGWNPYRGSSRTNPTASIFASSLYLANLYKRYGSWERVLSVYISGGPDTYKSSRAVRKYVGFILRHASLDTRVVSGDLKTPVAGNLEIRRDFLRDTVSETLERAWKRSLLPDEVRIKAREWKPYELQKLKPPSGVKKLGFPLGIRFPPGFRGES